MLVNISITAHISAHCFLVLVLIPLPYKMAVKNISSKDSVKNLEDINRQDKKGYTKLYLATQEGKTKEVFELLSQGADSNIPDYRGLTPLHMAVKVRKKEDPGISIIIP